MEKENVNEKVIDALKDTLDCNLYFLDESVSISTMYMVLGISIIILISIYIIINKVNSKKI